MSDNNELAQLLLREFKHSDTKFLENAFFEKYMKSRNMLNFQYNDTNLQGNHLLFKTVRTAGDMRNALRCVMGISRKEWQGSKYRTQRRINGAKKTGLRLKFVADDSDDFKEFYGCVKKKIKEKKKENVVDQLNKLSSEKEIDDVLNEFSDNSDNEMVTVKKQKLDTECFERSLEKARLDKLEADRLFEEEKKRQTAYWAEEERLKKAGKSQILQPKRSHLCFMNYTEIRIEWGWIKFHDEDYKHDYTWEKERKKKPEKTLNDLPRDSYHWRNLALTAFLYELQIFDNIGEQCCDDSSECKSLNGVPLPKFAKDLNGFQELLQYKAYFGFPEVKYPDTRTYSVVPFHMRIYLVKNDKLLHTAKTHFDFWDFLDKELTALFKETDGADMSYWIKNRCHKLLYKPMMYECHEEHSSYHQCCKKCLKLENAVTLFMAVREQGIDSLNIKLLPLPVVPTDSIYQLVMQNMILWDDFQGLVDHGKHGSYKANYEKNCSDWWLVYYYIFLRNLYVREVKRVSQINSLDIESKSLMGVNVFGKPRPLIKDIWTTYVYYQFYNIRTSHACNDEFQHCFESYLIKFADLLKEIYCMRDVPHAPRSITFWDMFEKIIFERTTE